MKSERKVNFKPGMLLKVEEKKDGYNNNYNKCIVFDIAKNEWVEIPSPFYALFIKTVKVKKSLVTLNIKKGLAVLYEDKLIRVFPWEVSVAKEI